MPRYRMLIEYDGTPYCGWQRQTNGLSVQAAIEQAFLSLTGTEVLVRGAGRTDSGVHAKGQVAHADLGKAWEPEVLRNAVNAHLMKKRQLVSILEVSEVGKEFDARFSASRRHYVYRIISRRSPLALEANRAWWLAKPLNYEKMHEAAQRLVGHHDFTTFRALHCQATSPIRTLDRLDVTRNGEVIEIHASAQSFLHNQIRSFAGTLKLVGQGKWSPDDVSDALAARDRRRCGPVAPPHGLYFMKVDFGPRRYATKPGDDNQASPK